MFIKLLKIVSVEEINETVANITLIFDITGKIKKVISIRKMIIDLLCKLFDRVFIWNVSYHNGSSGVVQDVIWSNYIYATFFIIFVGIVVGVNCLIIIALGHVVC